MKESKHLCLSNFFVISDLLTEDSKVFLKIKLISGEITAGDPLSGEGEADIGGALRKEDKSY